MKKLVALLLLLCLAGCGTHTEVPTQTPTATPTETPTAMPTETPTETEVPSPVYTDWSKYTPYQPVQQLYSYHPGYTGEGSFVARDDYGALLPYIGKYATMEMYVIDALPLFGLVTSKGEIVSDSVYTYIHCNNSFLVLYRGIYSLTVAAPDGRWVRELNDSVYISGGDSWLLTGAGDGSLDLWNTNGENVMHFDGSLFAPWLGENYSWGREEGPTVGMTDDRVGEVYYYYVDDAGQPQNVNLYLDFESGAVTDTPPEGYPAEIDYGSIPDGRPEPPVIEGAEYLSHIRDDITGETYFYGHYREHFALFDRTGKLLIENAVLERFDYRVIVRAGLCATVEDGCFCYLSVADGTPVFRYAMWTNSD